MDNCHSTMTFFWLNIDRDRASLISAGTKFLNWEVGDGKLLSLPSRPIIFTEFLFFFVFANFWKCLRLGIVYFANLKHHQLPSEAGAGDIVYIVFNNLINFFHENIDILLMNNYVLSLSLEVFRLRAIMIIRNNSKSFFMNIVD